MKEKSLNQENLEEDKFLEYQETSLLIENVKEEAVKAEIFDKSFLNDLNFHFMADFKKEGDNFNTYEVKSDGSMEIIDDENMPIGSDKDVYVFSKSFYKIDGWLSDDFGKEFYNKEELNERIISKSFIENTDFNLLYSFDSIVAHEIAHAKSFGLIPLKSDNFNHNKFENQIKEIIKNDLILQKINDVDFNKYFFNIREWSEIYALLYQREFLRRKDSSNEIKIKEWDNRIFYVADNLNAIAKEKSEKLNKDMKPNLIYGDCHTFSYLLANPLERKFENFDDRIKFLESFKK